MIKLKEFIQTKEFKEAYFIPIMDEFTMSSANMEEVFITLRKMKINEIGVDNEDMPWIASIYVQSLPLSEVI